MSLTYGDDYDARFSSICDIFKLARKHDVEIDIRFDKDLNAFEVTLRKDNYNLRRWMTDIGATLMPPAEMIWKQLNKFIREMDFNIEWDKKHTLRIEDDSDSSGLLEE